MRANFFLFILMKPQMFPRIKVRMEYAYTDNMLQFAYSPRLVCMCRHLFISCDAFRSLQHRHH